MSSLKFPVDSQRRYMRIPFKTGGQSFDGCDCGGLAWLVLKTELGIEVPDYHSYYTGTQIEDIEDMDAACNFALGSCFERRNERHTPKPFDIVCLKIYNMPVHVGIIVTPTTFMHIMEGFSNVRQERLDAFNWRRRIEGIYTHKELLAV